MRRSSIKLFALRTCFLGIVAFGPLRDSELRSQAPGSLPAAVRKDLYGDPLPIGALQRLGTMRFQHTFVVIGTAFSPDGRILASVGDNEVLKFWEIPGGRRRGRWQNEGARWTGPVTFSPDGKTLALAAADWTVTLFDSAAGTVSGSSGNWTVTGSHVYAQNGTYTVTVTLTVSGGGSQTASSSVTVSRAALGVFVMAINASANFTLTNAPVATFTDANAQDTSSTYTATINWGDGSASSTGTITGSAGLFQVLGSHSYANAGDYPLTVTLGVSGTTVAAGVNVLDPAAWAATLEGPGVVPSFSEYVYAMPLPPFSVASEFVAGTWLITDPGHISTTLAWGVQTAVQNGVTDALYQWVRLRFGWQVQGNVTVNLVGARWWFRRLAPPPLNIDVFKLVVGKLVAYANPLPGLAEMKDPRPFRVAPGADNSSVPWYHFRGDGWDPVTGDKNFWLTQIKQFFPKAPKEPAMVLASRADRMASTIQISTSVTLQPPATLHYGFYEYYRIQVGFIQTATVNGVVTYGAGQARRWTVKDGAKYGVDWLVAGIPNSNPITDPWQGGWPWYFLGNNIAGGTPGPRRISLTLYDSPSIAFPKYYEGHEGGTSFSRLVAAYNFTVNVVSTTISTDSYNPTWNDQWHALWDKTWYRDYIQGYVNWGINWSAPVQGRPGAQLMLDGVDVSQIHGAIPNTQWHLPANPDVVIVNVVPAVLYSFYVPWPTWEG